MIGQHPQGQEEAQPSQGRDLALYRHNLRQLSGSAELEAVARGLQKIWVVAGIGVTSYFPEKPAAEQCERAPEFSGVEISEAAA